MSGSNGVQIELRFEPSAYQGFYAPGTPVRVIAAFLDGAASPLAVGGVVIEIEEPGAATIFRYPDPPADGIGRHYVDILPGREGGWLARASCLEPVPQSKSAQFTVAAVEGGERLPPVVVTNDLGPVITQRGGMLTGTRVRYMEQTTSFSSATLIYGVVEGADRAVPGDVLLQAAATAGSTAGSDSGVTAAQEAVASIVRSVPLGLDVGTPSGGQVFKSWAMPTAGYVVGLRGAVEGISASVRATARIHTAAAPEGILIDGLTNVDFTQSTTGRVEPVAPAAFPAGATLSITVPIEPAGTVTRAVFSVEIRQ